MREQQVARWQRLAREKAVYQYTTALERGDIEKVAEILHKAIHDATLEQMILEVHEVYRHEDSTALPSDAGDHTAPPPLLHTLQAPARPFKRRQRFSALVQMIAAVLVVGALLGSFLVLTTFRDRGSGSPPGAMPLKGKPIRIGLTVPLTGDFYADGAATIKGYQLWAENVNKNGGLLGRPVELDFLSDNSHDQQVTTDYTKLITVDHVDLVVGPFGFQTLPAAKVASHYGYAFVNGTGTYGAFFAAQLHNVFSVSPPSDSSLTGFARFLLSLPRSMRPKTAAYATGNDPFNKPQVDLVRRMLEQGGISTVSYAVFPDETTNYTTLAQQVITSRASVVVLGTTGVPDSTLFIQAFKQQHYNPQALIATSGPDQGTAFTDAIGLASTEGVFVPNGGWYPGIHTYQNAQFVRDYITKYGGTPEGISSDTVQAFATGQVLEQAVRKISSINNAALIQELHTDTFNSLQGPVKFDSIGRNILAVSYVFQWQEGHLLPVFPSTIALARPEFPKAAWP